MKWTPPPFTKSQPVRDPRQRLWNAMIVQKRFTVPQLARLAEASVPMTRSYLKALRRIRYVRMACPAQKGQFGGHAHWQLVCNTGPVAPLISAQDQGVLDLNCKQFLAYSAALEASDEPAPPVIRPVAAPAAADPADMMRPMLMLRETWLDALRAACAADTQVGVAKRLGVSPSTVNQALKGTYKGDLQRLQTRVEGVLQTQTVGCPALGDIRKDRCQEYQDRNPKLAAATPITARLYRACRSGCPHSKLPKEY